MTIDKLRAVPAVLLLAAAGLTLAEEAELDRPSFYASQSVTVAATIEAIDHETREVTLRMPEGDTVSFIADEEVRNLGQVTVGDIVNAEYIETLSIEVFANEGMEPDAAEMTAMARAEAGDMPGVAAVDTRIVTATVEEIDIEANTFKLRTPDGKITEYAARNPQNLKRASVGDLVVFTVTDAVAISVEHAPAE